MRPATFERAFGDFLLEIPVFNKYFRILKNYRLYIDFL